MSETRNASASRVWQFGTVLATAGELATWLQSKKITPVQWATIQTNLGYTPASAATALAAGVLVAEDIWAAYQDL